MNEDNNRATLPATNMEQNISDESMGKEKTKGLDSRVIITVTSYRKLNHDPDGISAKAVIDGIVRAGLLPDDSAQEVKKVIFESVISKEEKTVIEITNE